MSVRYITNETGETTDVVIPVGEWKAVLRKLYGDDAESYNAYLLQSEPIKKRLTEAGTREDITEERESWLRVSARGLESAYGPDEPEYSAEMIKNPNPEFRP